MQTSIKPNDILNAIDFELMQGILLDDDLGEGVRAAQKHQNQIRSELLDTQNRDINLRDALDRQLQINDLLLTLVERTNLKLDKFQSELHRSTALNLRLPLTEEVQNLDLPETTTSTTASLPSEPESSVNHNYIPTEVNPSSLEMSSDLQLMLQENSLQITPDVRIVKMPLIGNFLTRLRITFHNLVLFYINRLAGQQSRVNQAYVEELLNLYHLEKQSMEQIQRLRKTITNLESKT